MNPLQALLDPFGPGQDYGVLLVFAFVALLLIGAWILLGRWRK